MFSLSGGGRVDGDVCGDKSRYYEENRDLFLTLTKCILCLNLTRPYGQKHGSPKYVNANDND